MSTFSVKVRTETGTFHYERIGTSSAKVHEDEAERFGNLCAVTVVAK